MQSIQSLWKLDEEKLQEQVAGYKTLQCFRIVRYHAAFFFIFIFLFSALFILSSNVGGDISFLDIFLSFAIYAPLVTFMVLGHVWAHYALIGWWTIDKFVTTLYFDGSGGSLVVATVFWLGGTALVLRSLQVTKEWKKRNLAQ